MWNKRFSSLNYEMIQRDGKDGLLIESEEKTFAPPTLQPAVVIDGSQYNSIRFSLGGRLTFMDLGGYRSELRTDFILGSTYGIDSEYYRPFTPESHWFLTLCLQSLSSNGFGLDLYSRGDRIAEYGLNQAGAEGWISATSSTASSQLMGRVHASDHLNRSRAPVHPSCPREAGN